MWRTLHRTRGASALGAAGPGDTGPYGRWPDHDDDDGGGLDDEDDQERDDKRYGYA